MRLPFYQCSVEPKSLSGFADLMVASLLAIEIGLVASLPVVIGKMVASLFASKWKWSPSLPMKKAAAKRKQS
jgi:hypothetical protein